ncbi:MAG: hypothetical protein PHY94_06950 [Candidatus Omnitrophica bacterium]|nr:hypothetical protein [Candidatus Omnitrophota bacterium]
MTIYHLDFVLSAPDTSLEVLKKSLEGGADNPEIRQSSDENSPGGKSFMIQVRTQDPTLIFDICSQYGKISSVKVNEEGV